MKKSKVFTIVLAVALALSFFISCSNEVEQDAGVTTVRFTPYASKALNQSGTATQLSNKVEDYHWKYYCSTEKPDTNNTGSLTWVDFSDKTSSTDTGLGVIPNLSKGTSYYFGLRGYTTGSNAIGDLVWEGFHYNDSTPKAPVKERLTSKNQLITISVYTKGKGYLYFNITAPVVMRMGINQTSGTDSLADRFCYSYQTLDGTTSGTNASSPMIGKYDTPTDSYVYADASNAGKEMPTGEYLFTIWQESWDDAEKKFVKLTERKQVLIVNIVSGVDTVIAGSLDSTSPLSVLDYDAGGYTDDDKRGIQVRFNSGDASDVRALDLNVYPKSDSDSSKFVNQYDTIRVYNKDWVTIKWPAKMGSVDVETVEVWVNGYQLLTEASEEKVTDTDFPGINFIRSSKNKGSNPWLEKDYKTFVAEFDNSEKTVKCYAKAGNSYLVTIKAGNTAANAFSKTFTIVGYNGEATDKTTSSDYTFATVPETVQLNNSVSGTKVSLSKATLLNIANSFGYATATDTPISLSFDVLETNKTTKSVELSIDLKAKVGTTETNFKGTADDYITAEIKVDKGLDNVVVKHYVGTNNSEEQTMNMLPSYTSFTDVVAGYETGHCFYDREAGILYLKSMKFSPFKLEFSALPVTLDGKAYANLQDAVDAAYNGATLTVSRAIVLDKTVEVKNGKNFTINLAGDTVKVSSEKVNTLFDINKAYVKITGTGTIDNTDSTTDSDHHDMIKVHGSDSPSASGYGLFIDENVVLKSNGYAVQVAATQAFPHAYGVVVEIDSTNVTVTNDAVATVNGWIVDTTGNIPEVILNGCVATSSDLGLYAAGYAKYKVMKATLIAENTAIEIRAGELIIDDGQFTATTTPTSVTPNGNGSTTKGAALAVSQHTTLKPIKVVVNGGEFNGYSAIYLTSATNGSVEANYAESSVKVKGGKFNATSDSENVIDNVCPSLIKVTLAGGTFNKEPNEDYYNLEANYEVAEKDSSWVVKKK